ncbi:phospho-sugar mutase [Schumannella sp. 10F1B-5-1]|uniref:phospho-sugar mutase n=1 Tax=Schumannella sp. 10F1B-5-1 TaxID=2590780 RepID=UPI0011323601|nr:phospho-sugar mutase [Schumannella sp. 10F1B-5-1]TPW73531.1 phospho-sugar mutase [Schumannella sp. 10F1B-5-1]
MSPRSVLESARAWIAQDPDAVTRDELQRLVDAAGRAGAAGGDDAAEHASRELAARFDGRLEFGTAGLRGELGAGPQRMNRVLVSQAAAGLAAFLLAREAHPSIVVGFDGRHNSEAFARDTVELMQGAGVDARLLPRRLPTPVLAFAVRRLDASAGVMVTASHNPARDNGYKVYLGGADAGSQIVAPSDAEIQEQILRVAAGSIADLPRSDAWTLVDESVVDDYVAATAGVASAAARPIPFVYTAMHGVGYETAARVFASSGFGEPVVVAEQRDPDPDFPTVPFPNPEEEGAMDLSFALAARSGVKLIIANDPDADRLAVGIPDASTTEGWRRLSGNEVGMLLGDRAARAVVAGDASSDGPRAAAATGRTLACSLVSSPGLGAIARTAGLGHVETLTGFKWISRAPDLAFGFEEALGYLVNPGTVRDKDGISAAVALLDLASALDAEGRTIAEALDDLAERVGGYASGQISIRVAELADIPRMVGALRAAPPTSIGGVAVESIDDFLDGVGDYPPSDILRYRLAGDSRVIVRPSGTEPKLKVYLDAASTSGTGAERLAAARDLVARLDAGMRELLA